MQFTIINFSGINKQTSEKFALIHINGIQAIAAKIKCNIYNPVKYQERISMFHCRKYMKNNSVTRFKLLISIYAHFIFKVLK